MKLPVSLIFCLFLFGLIVAPIHAIIILIFISVLAIPVYLVFWLQKYLFSRYKKVWHLMVIAIIQFICFALPIYWLFYQFEQAVEVGTLDGPTGFASAMVISTLAISMMIIWVVNCITAGIVYSKINRNRPA